MDKQFLKATVHAVQQTFETMLNWKISPTQIVIGEISNGSEDLTALISFAGRISGTMVLTQKLAVAQTMASRLLEMSDKDNIEETKDAIGELLNVIISVAKCTYDPHKEPFSISIPTVIVGKEYQIHVQTEDESNVSWLEFATEDGDAIKVRLHLK